MAPEERSVAEVMINGKMEPSLIEGGQLVKTLSIGFLADLEEDWRAHGKKVFPCCGRNTHRPTSAVSWPYRR